MFRTHLLAWAAALGFALLGAQESWAQRGHAHTSGGHASGGHASHRPSVAPVHHVAPVYRAAIAPSHSHITAGNSARFHPIIPATHSHITSGVWQGGTTWAHHQGSNAAALAHHHPASNGAIWAHRHSGSNGNWNGEAHHRHRRFFNDHHRFLLPSFVYFNPGLDSYWNWGLQYSDYYAPPLYYPYSADATPNYGDYYGGEGLWTPAQVGARFARIDVILPDANAEVFFGDYKTKSLGKARQFESPVLQPDKTYSYVIRAVWDRNGETVTQQREVTVSAGARVAVDFTQPPPKQ
jgi:uncharacterized protein (TIGR03000 family)